MAIWLAWINRPWSLTIKIEQIISLKYIIYVLLETLLRVTYGLPGRDLQSDSLVVRLTAGQDMGIWFRHSFHSPKTLKVTPAASLRISFSHFPTWEMISVGPCKLEVLILQWDIFERFGRNTFSSSLIRTNLLKSNEIKNWLCKYVI